MSSAEITALEPAAASDRLRRSVRLLFIGVFFLLASLLAANLYFSRTEALDYGARRAANLAVILSSHFVRTVNGIDTTLSQVALVSSRIGGPAADSSAWNATLDAARNGVGGLAGSGKRRVREEGRTRRAA